MTEALALWQGLQLAKAQGINDIVVIGDSRLVIQALTTSIPPTELTIRHLLRKIQSVVPFLQAIGFFHVLGKHNTLADLAANLASSLDKGVLLLNATRCCSPQIYACPYGPLP